MAPQRVWEDDKKEQRLYTEMMTGDFAWDIQVWKLPPGIKRTNRKSVKGSTGGNIGPGYPGV